MCLLEEEGIGDVIVVEAHLGSQTDSTAWVAAGVSQLGTVALLG